MGGTDRTDVQTWVGVGSPALGGSVTVRTVVVSRLEVGRTKTKVSDWGRGG